jgi:hypothetical protein
MGTYDFDHFPFDDPDIARALSRALAILLWSSVPRELSPLPSSPRRARQRRGSVQQQANMEDAKEQNE